MNTSRLVHKLAELCLEHLLEEKWLLAPSLRVGHQWLDAVTRTGQPTVNVRIKTLRSMALELAAPEMAAKNLGLLSGHAGPMLVDQVFRRLRTEGLAYLGPTGDDHATPPNCQSASWSPSLRLSKLSEKQIVAHCQFE